jgi:hypothetical protein
MRALLTATLTAALLIGGATTASARGTLPTDGMESQHRWSSEAALVSVKVKRCHDIGYLPWRYASPLRVCATRQRTLR